jgi:two-component system sensor histidine kinase VicK
MILSLVTLTLLGTFFIGQYQRQAMRNFDDSIVVPATTQSQLSDLLDEPETADRDNQISTIIESLSFSSSTNIYVFDDSAKIVAVSNADSQKFVGQQITGLTNANKQVIQSLDKTSSYQSNLSVKQNGQRLKQLITLIEDDPGERATTRGAIVVSANVERVYQSVSDVVKIFVSALLIPIIATIGISLVISRYLTRPIEAVAKQAKLIADGQFQSRNDIEGNDELSDLAHSMNRLAERLQDTTGDVSNERNRLDSVLSNMYDGVLAVNRLGEVTIINEAGLDFFNLTEDQVVGKKLVGLLGYDKTGFSLRDLLKSTNELTIDLS